MEMIPVFNPVPSNDQEIFFENTVLEKIWIDDPECDWLGVTSWKMNQVTGLTGSQLKKLVEKISHDHDVLLYCPQIAPAYRMESPWIRYFNDGSPYNERLRQMTLMVNDAKALPIELTETTPWVFNYRNYWIMRRQWFREFVLEWIIPLLKLYRKNNINLPVRYKGQPNHPSQPFFMENMIGTFLGHNPQIKYHQI